MNLGLTPYHTLQASTIKGTPVARIYTSAYGHFQTVEKTKEQVGLEKARQGCNRGRT